MLELKAKSRTELGRAVKPLRKAGLMPGVVYGEKVKSQSISVLAKDFEKIYKNAGESTLIKLQVTDNSKEQEFNVLIHDIKNHPVRGNPIHADFYAVRMDREIKAKLPLVFIGKSPAIDNDGGILVKVMQEVEIEALPQDLVKDLSVDISGLEVISARMTAGDLKLPQGIKLISGVDEVVALIEAPRTDADLDALKEAPVESTTEVKTEQEIKKELAASEKEVEVEEKSGN